MTPDSLDLTATRPRQGGGMHGLRPDELFARVLQPDDDDLLPAEKSGDVIGRYRLLERIGSGGFGVVWRAEQLEPIHRLVALKVIKPGMDSREIMARFAAEQQALALMDHPNIAAVLDAGATAGG